MVDVLGGIAKIALQTHSSREVDDRVHSPHGTLHIRTEPHVTALLLTLSDQVQSADPVPLVNGGFDDAAPDET